MKATGITKSVNNVEVIKPPMTTVANGGHNSFSRPVVSASGHSAAIVVAVVISTGRVRSRTDAKAAAPSRPAAANLLLHAIHQQNGGIDRQAE